MYFNIYPKKWSILKTMIFIFLVMCCCSIFSFKVSAYDEIVIVVDPGHGGVDDEADYGARFNNADEKDVNLITARALCEELAEYGNVRTYLTRDEDKKLSLDERVAGACAVNADVMISVHYNASSLHNFFGSEIFVSAFGQPYVTGHSLAEHVMDAWSRDGAVSKGIKTRLNDAGNDYYGLIRQGCQSNLPVIILEHGYMDNDRDWDRIGNEDYWKHLGVIDADAIAEYYGLEKNVVKQNVTVYNTVELPSAPVLPKDAPPTDIEVTIDSYNSETGEIKYSVKADAGDGMLMYFGLETEAEAADDEAAFSKLNLWEPGNDTMTGEGVIPKKFNSNVIVRVYNNYEQYTDSDKISISPAKPFYDNITVPDVTESKAPGDMEISIDKDKYEASLKDTDVTEPEEEEEISEEILPNREEKVKELQEQSRELSQLKDEYERRAEQQQKLIYILFGVIVVVIIILIVFIITSIKKNGKDRDDDGFEY